MFLFSSVHVVTYSGPAGGVGGKRWRKQNKNSFCHQHNQVSVTPSLLANLTGLLVYTEVCTLTKVSTASNFPVLNPRILVTLTLTQNPTSLHKCINQHDLVTCLIHYCYGTMHHSLALTSLSTLLLSFRLITQKWIISAQTGVYDSNRKWIFDNDTLRKHNSREIISIQAWNYPEKNIFLSVIESKCIGIGWGTGMT